MIQRTLFVFVCAVLILSTQPAAATAYEQIDGGEVEKPIVDRIVVDLKDLRLHAYADGAVFMEAPVAIGKPPHSTPQGKFIIKYRLQNPWYTPADSEAAAPMSPENPLGSRWMGFKSMPSYGLHGTNRPDHIGKRASRGCVRLRNETVNELYAHTPPRTPVVIRYRSEHERPTP